MPLINSISGSTFGAHDGAAATFGPGNTGLAAGTASAWTIHQASSTQLPPWSSATGYLESGLNNGALGRIALQLDPTGTALPSPGSGNNADYWLNYSIMGVWDGSTGMSPGNDYHLLLGGSVFGYARIYNQSVAANGGTGQPQFNAPGWAVYSNSTTTGTVTLNGPVLPGANQGCIHVPWGAWAECWVHVQYGTSGLIEFFINGRKVTQVTCDTTQITWSGQAFQMQFPAMPGVKWRVTGPIQSWNGTDVSIRPRWNLETGGYVNRLLFPVHTVAAGANTQGVDWSYATTGSGAVTVDAAEFSGSGSAGPTRRRFVISGAANDTATLTSVDEFGAPTYNAQGWYHVGISDLYVPANNVLNFQVCQPGGTSNFLTLQVNSGKLIATYTNAASGYNVAPWNPSLRYCLVLHFHRDGRMAFTLVDVTSSLTSASVLKSTWSGPLQNWSNLVSGPLSLGKLTLMATMEGSPPPNIEAGFVAAGPRLSFTAIDSYTSAAYTGVTPNLRGHDHIGRSFPTGRDEHLIPGGYYRLAEFGMPRRIVLAPLGNTGLRRHDYSQIVGSGLNYTKGVEIIMIGGGSFNDIAEVGGATDATAAIETLKRGIEHQLEWAVRNDVALWYATMLPPARSVAISGATNANPIVLTATANGFAAGVQSNCYVFGVGGNTAANGYWGNIASVSGDSITLTGVAGNGAYTGGGTIQCLTPTQAAAVASFNQNLRALLSQYQAKGLFSLSDIEADYNANGSTYYPNSGGTFGFWGDILHPQDPPATAFYIGSGAVAMRMVMIQRTVPARPPLRRWAAAR